MRLPVVVCTILDLVLSLLKLIFRDEMVRACDRSELCGKRPEFCSFSLVKPIIVETLSDVCVSISGIVTPKQLNLSEVIGSKLFLSMSKEQTKELKDNSSFYLFFIFYFNQNTCCVSV